MSLDQPPKDEGIQLGMWYDGPIFAAALIAGSVGCALGLALLFLKVF